MKADLLGDPSNLRIPSVDLHSGFKFDTNANLSATMIRRSRAEERTVNERSAVFSLQGTRTLCVKADHSRAEVREALRSLCAEGALFSSTHACNARAVIMVGLGTRC